MRTYLKWVATVTLIVCAVTVVYATSYTDDFECANADSPDCDVDWTEEQGDVDVQDLVAANGAGSFAKGLVVAPTLSSAEQFGSFNLDQSGSAAFYAGLTLRYTNSSSPYYEVIFWTNEDIVQWGYFTAAADTTADSIGSNQALTIADDDFFGITITGTGTSTVVRVWRNPTGAVTAADNWNGDNTPDVAWTDDPPSPVDSGNIAGFALYGNSFGNALVDNITLGDLPGGGGGGGGTKPKLLLTGVGHQ
jgi:hypothetical protein